MIAESVAPALRVLVVDDEPLACEDLLHLLRARQDVTVVGVCGGGAEGLAAVHRLLPDVLLLDIRMPGLDGFGLIAQLETQRMPYVVFVTAFDRYAVDAFRVRALDYVLKPVQPARLDEALRRAREQLRTRALLDWAGALQAAARAHATEGLTSAPPRPCWTEVMVRVGTREVLLRVNDIEWVEADTYYARLHVGGRSYLLRERMHVLEANLDPRRFVRVHRSAIVNIAHVREVRHDDRGEHFVVLASGRQIKTSRPRWLSVRSVLRQRIRPEQQ